MTIKEIKMKKFKFELQQTVEVNCSGETGTILGRAEYSHTDNNYLILYKAGDGRAVETWWTESALVAA